MKKTMIIKAKQINFIISLAVLLCIGHQSYTQCPTGVIYLESQNAVDNFTTNYPNCTELLNSLCIGACSNNTPNTDITNLSGLSGITSVDGYLSLRYVDNLSDLNGLSNLNYVGDNFTAIHAESILNLTGIGDLTIAGEFGIFNCDAITSLTGINILSTSVIGIQHNPILTDISALNSVSSLDGQLVIQNNDLLTNLSGLENITTLNPPGASFIYIDGNAVLSDISAIQNIDAASINSNWPSADLRITNNPQIAVCEHPNICEFIELAESDPSLTTEIYGNAVGCNSVAEIEAACSPPSLPFITTWKTDNFGTSNSSSITIPTTGTGYSYDVDWENDGIYDDFDITGDISHDYGTAGNYQVVISGDFPRIYFNNQGDCRKIISIDQWGNNIWNSMENAFSGCQNLAGQSTDNPNLDQVTNASNMFSLATVFNQDISEWDVSKITNMSAMFSSTNLFNQDISGWDVSSVTNMVNMFSYTEAFNQNLDIWDVSSVQSTRWMFIQANAFNGNIGNWNVSNVTDMFGMFANTDAFNQDIGGWDVSSVTNMMAMFANADAFNQDISGWDVSSVTNMQSMFANTAIFNQDIGGWNVSTNTNFYRMFDNSVSFNQDISNWDITNAWSISEMFDAAQSFNQNLSNWDFSNVGNIGHIVSNSGLSIQNYDNLLQSLASQDVMTNRFFGGTNLEYCEGADARDLLINDQNWTFTGDQLICPFSLNGTVIQPTCGLDNGVIDANPTNGIPPFSYTLDGNPITLPINNLSPGTYLLGVIDDDGESSNEELTLNISDPLTFTLIGQETTCNLSNGIITSMIQTGTEPISYYDEGLTPVVLPVSGISAGIYSIIGTDVDGCKDTVSVTIDPSIDIDLVFNSVSTTCGQDNGVINSIVDYSNGNVIYEIDGVVTTLPVSGLPSSIYEMQATDADGCS